MPGWRSLASRYCCIIGVVMAGGVLRICGETPKPTGRVPVGLLRERLFHPASRERWPASRERKLPEVLPGAGLVPPGAYAPGSPVSQRRAWWVPLVPLAHTALRTFDIVRRLPGG